MYIENTKELIFTEKDKLKFEEIFDKLGLVPTQIVVALGGITNDSMMNGTYFCFPGVTFVQNVFLDILDAWMEVFNPNDLGDMMVFPSKDELNQYIVTKSNGSRIYTIFENGKWNFCTD